MAQVDIDDDTIRRFVVRHYRFDPDRHERRHVVVGVYDTEAEFLEAMEQVRAEIAQRVADGGRAEPTEYASGSVYEPGDRARAATHHMVRRMLEHGVDPSRHLDPQDWPTGIAFASAKLEPDPPGLE
jgi:hypothetical protein